MAHVLHLSHRAHQPPLSTASGSTSSTPCAASRSPAYFLLNLASFTGFAFMTPEQMSALPTASVDLPVAGLIVWLGYGKFYSLFSLLFGVGFSLQLAAAERRGDDRLPSFADGCWC